jgi:hypothetical protein
MNPGLIETDPSPIALALRHRYAALVSTSKATRHTTSEYLRVQAYLCSRLYVGNVVGNRQFTLVVNIRGAPSRANIYEALLAVRI